MNNRISSAISSSARSWWMDTVKRTDLRSNPTAWWRLLKGLSGKRRSQPPNQPISFFGKPSTKSAIIANLFYQQYANVKIFEHKKESRAVFRNNKINNPIDYLYSPFTPAHTIKVFRTLPKPTLCGFNRNMREICVEQTRAKFCDIVKWGEGVGS